MRDVAFVRGERGAGHVAGLDHASGSRDVTYHPQAGGLLHAGREESSGDAMRQRNDVRALDRRGGVTGRLGRWATPLVAVPLLAFSAVAPASADSAPLEFSDPVGDISPATTDITSFAVALTPTTVTFSARLAAF